MYGVKYNTFLGWVVDDHDGLADKYMRVQRIRAMKMRDDILPILDDGRNDWMQRETGGVMLNSEHIRRSEVRASYRERFIDKMLPRALGGVADAQDAASIHIHVDAADTQV